jgi:hypothetical protein
MRRLASGIAMIAVLFTIASAHAQELPKIPAEVMAVLECFEGTWECTGRVGDAKGKGQFTARFARGRHALITQDTFTIEGETTIAVGVMGWDPSTNRATHGGFVSNTDTFFNQIETMEPGKWTGSLSGTRDGEDFNGEFTITIKTPDQLVFESENADGEEVEILWKKTTRQRRTRGERSE